MQSMIPKTSLSYDSRRRDCSLDSPGLEILALHSYNIADAMLKQREL